LTTATGRAGMVSIGNTLAAHASLLDYTEGADRMMGEKLTWSEVLAMLAKGERLTGDCASFYTEACMWAGCSDPNRLNFDGYGYTGTLLNSMPHITLAEAQNGDAIVFGAWPGLHVVWVTEPSATNPKIDSHGRPGFDQTTFLAMRDSEFSTVPYTVLSLAPFLPKVPPPPADPHGYLRLDTTPLKGMPHPNVGKTNGTNTEQKVVQTYDKARLNPKANAKELALLKVDLQWVVKRIENNEKNDPKHTISEDRPFRLAQAKLREAGNQVVK
jgi:hypothetical protein